jgi:NAD(P)-dependent dehydrogenase (short-subunit alcohol dehydrogenase family)
LTGESFNTYLSVFRQRHPTTMALIGQVMANKFYPPKASTEPFEGKTVLITGTSAGLGLEAAKKLAALHTSTLIITARDEEKAAAVKKEIEAFLETSLAESTTSNSTQIVPMTLDMSSTAGVISFITALKAKIQHLDAAILNAGTFQTQHQKSSDGWEETIQVNTVSTLLLGTLLLPLLLASPSTTSPNATMRPHLNFVSSSYSNRMTIAYMNPATTSSTPVTLLSSPRNFPTGVLGGQIQYGRSKLLLEYGMRHLAQLPAVRETSSGTPKVIITSCCPGMCKSELGRQFQANMLARVAMWLTFALFGRTAEQGCNTYLTALNTNESVHGGMWMSDTILEPGEMVTTEEGSAFGEKVWIQLKEVLGQADEGAREALLVK